MPKWIEGTVVNQKRWTQDLVTLQVEADVAAFEAADPAARGAVATLQERGRGARGALCRGADLPRQPVAAAGGARRADARRLLREPRGKNGRAPRARSHRDRGGSPGGRGGRRAQRE